MDVRAPELKTEPALSASTRPVARTDVDPTELRWRRRPGLRAAIRLAVILAPAIAAAAVAITFSRLVPIPADLVGGVVWWAVFSAAIVAAWMLSSELLQRALPLATLLDLTLVFPHTVPSRIAILRRHVDRRQLEDDLRQLRERSDPESGARAQLILELAVALSLHDSRTRGHSERVRMYTDMVAQELHLHQRDADRLRWAALLHDIGKLAVAPEVLNKPERPDDEERESLRNHPIEGFRIIEPLHKWLGEWAATVRDHHERFDGTGYPNGLRGRAISLGGRIVAVTDSYETMTAGRPYRSALSVMAAREELVRRSGSHFDPDVVRAFLAVSVGRLWPVIGVGALSAGVPFLGPLSSRVFRLGSRSFSGIAAAGVTVTLIYSGLAGPIANGTVHGPSVSEPAVAGVLNLGQSLGKAMASLPATAPPSLSSSTGNSKSVGPSGSSAPAAGGARGASSGAPAAGGGKALYPAGIAKQATLPPGIAKKPDPFAQWRSNH